MHIYVNLFSLFLPNCPFVLRPRPPKTPPEELEERVSIYKTPQFPRWECLAIQCNLGCFSLGAWFFTTTTTYMLNLEGLYTWKNFVVTWILGSVSCSLVWVGSMAGWVYILGLRYPAPMVGLWATGWGLFAQVRSPAREIVTSQP